MKQHTGTTMKNTLPKKAGAVLKRLNEIGISIQGGTLVREVMRNATQPPKNKRDARSATVRRNFLSLIRTIDALGRHLTRKVNAESPSDVKKYILKATADITKYEKLHAVIPSKLFKRELQFLLPVERKQELFEKMETLVKETLDDEFNKKMKDLWKSTFSKEEQEELARRKAKLPFTLNPNYKRVTKNGITFKIPEEAARVLEELAKRYLQKYPNIPYEEKGNVFGEAKLGGKKPAHAFRRCREAYKTLIDENPDNKQEFRLRS